MAALNFSRSSAVWMASTEAPINPWGTMLSPPVSCNDIARFRAVWPPSVGRTASGRSFSMIACNTRTSSGST